MKSLRHHPIRLQTSRLFTSVMVLALAVLLPLYSPYVPVVRQVVFFMVGHMMTPALYVLSPLTYFLPPAVAETLEILLHLGGVFAR